MKNIFTILILALSINAIAQIPTDSLVGFWPFTGNANDYSINSNDGVVNGALLTTDRFGNLNSAYEFDGVDDYIEVNHNAVLNFNSEMTVSAFLNTNSIGTVQTIFMKGNSNDGWEYLLDIRDDGKARFTLSSPTGTGAYAEVVSSTQLQSNQTYSIIVSVNDNDSLNLYINGILDTVSSDFYPANQYQNGNGSFAIGAKLGWVGHPDPALLFDGKIDDVRIYNRLLNIAEIEAIANEGLCYETITVTDTLIINANITGFNPVAFQNTIKIYPNPASDHLYIDTDNNSNGYEIKIINTLSQIVFQTTISQAQYDIDLNTWTGNGTYFVQFYNTDGNLIDVKKIIIQ